MNLIKEIENSETQKRKLFCKTINSFRREQKQGKKTKI